MLVVLGVWYSKFVIDLCDVYSWLVVEWLVFILDFNGIFWEFGFLFVVIYLFDNFYFKARVVFGK